MPNQVVGVWILRFNGQDRIVRSGKYGCSSIRVASVDENKNNHRKITLTHIQITCPNRIFLRAGKKKRGASCWVWSPGREKFDKSATELNQKLLKCKHTIQIATFNVRTLNRIGKLPELTASAIGHNIGMLYIQERRYTHSEDIKYHDSANGWMLATASAWENSVNAMIGGVGMLIGPRARKSLNGIEKIQPRMMVATFNGNPSETIISCYNPTNVSEETKLIAFYNEQTILVCSIPKHNVLVIGGDMNAQFGKNVNHKFSLHNLSNKFAPNHTPPDCFKKCRP